MHKIYFVFLLILIKTSSARKIQSVYLNPKDVLIQTEIPKYAASEGIHIRGVLKTL